MVVRPDVLRERVATLREVVSRLRDLRDRGGDDPVSNWAIERGLQIAAQALFDIGNHVLAGGFGARAAEYAAVPKRLAELGVIDAALEARLRGLAGFRNLLVHDYGKVDPQQVRQALALRLPDLEAFADCIETWIGAQSGP